MSYQSRPSQSLPPPPPNPHFKQTTIQFRNFNSKTADKTPEQCGCYKCHHPDIGLNGHGGHGRWMGEEEMIGINEKEKVEKRHLKTTKSMNKENIFNLLTPPPSTFSNNCTFPFQDHNHNHTSPNFNIVDKETTNYHNLPPPPKPSFTSPIPLNARKPPQRNAGHMGNGTGVPDPRVFVKKGSGGNFVGKVIVSGQGEKVEKWTRPKDVNFVAKLGKPKIVAAEVESTNDYGASTSVMKKNFLKDNKQSSTIVNVKDKTVNNIPTAPPKLGVMPKYLVDRKANDMVTLAASLSLAKSIRRERRHVKKLADTERLDLLRALTARRDAVLNLLVRAELGGRVNKRRALENEINALDVDILKLEDAGNRRGGVRITK